MRNLLFSWSLIALGGLQFGYIIGLTSNIVTSGQLLCRTPELGTTARSAHVLSFLRTRRPKHRDQQTALLLDEVPLGPGEGSWSSAGYRQCYVLSSLSIGLLNSLNLIGAMCATLVCYRYADFLGRRMEVKLSAALYLIGTLVAALVPVLWATYLGFLTYGFGIGFGMHVAPMFIAEIAPADIRGMLISLKEGVIVAGILLGFLAGVAFGGVEMYGWRLMTAVNVIFASIQGIGICFVPDSPRWLVLRNSGDDLEVARQALVFFRQSEDVDTELKAIKEDAESVVPASGSRRGMFEAFAYPRPLIIGCGLVTLQQVTGQPSVLYYATNIFKAAGFGGAAALSSVGIGVVKLIATLVSVALVERNGRRPLLFVGIGMMAVSLLTLSITMQRRHCRGGGPIVGCPQEDIVMPQDSAIVMLCALMVYVSGYQVGFGPIAWLMISEVFPLSVRGSAISVAALVNFSFNIVMTLLQGVLTEALTATGVFLLYFCFSLASLFFVYSLVPETKGKSLEQISSEMSGGKASYEQANC